MFICVYIYRYIYIYIKILSGEYYNGRRWVDNIRMDLQEVGCGYMDWIGLVQDRDRWRRLVSAVMNLRVPWNAGNFFTSCKPISCSRRTLHHGVSILIILTSYINASKHVRDHGYFWKPKGFREKKSLGNTPLNQYFLAFRLSRNP